VTAVEGEGGGVGSVVVRPAEAADLGGLASIERAAGERFRDVGLAAVADDEPLPVEVLARAADEGRAWVAELGGTVVGYAVGARLAGDPPQHHLEQVSVVPAAGGRGVGVALVEAVVAWAQADGGASLTLTTFTTVPWNGPWYRRLGFEVVDANRLAGALAAVVAHEATLGLDPSTRSVMRRCW
jgi:GNAT superfamily N-acetyltransferase